VTILKRLSVVILAKQWILVWWFDYAYYTQCEDYEWVGK